MKQKIHAKYNWNSIKLLSGLNYTHIANSCGYYIVDDGRVFSLSTGRFLKSIKDKDGYSLVNIYNVDATVKLRKIHRLVAEAFLPNPNKFEIVNHINEKKDDNRVENLEWCTVSENNIYGTRLQRVAEKKEIQGVHEYTVDGDYVQSFSDALSAAKHHNCNCQSIRNNCLGRSKSQNNRIFRYSKSDSISGLTEREKRYAGRYTNPARLAVEK